MFRWLINLFFSDKEKHRADKCHQPIELKAKCPSCGYEGDEAEFLEKDPWDTLCPKCGETVTLYEL